MCSFNVNFQTDCYFFSFPISALGGSSALHIPAFPSGGCLIDYVPQVCQLLTNKVKVFTTHPISAARCSLCLCIVLHYL